MSFSNKLEWYTALEVGYKSRVAYHLPQEIHRFNPNKWGLLENSDTHPNKLKSITQLIILANNFHSFWGAGNIREHTI